MSPAAPTAATASIALRTGTLSWLAAAFMTIWIFRSHPDREDGSAVPLPPGTPGGGGPVLRRQLRILKDFRQLFHVSADAGRAGIHLHQQF